MKTVFLATLWAITSLAIAGDMAIQPPQPFPTLETLVHKADLVLRCRAETFRGKVRWRVTEALKGDYRPKMFYQQSPGYIGCDTSTRYSTLATPSYHAGPQPKHNERVVFLHVIRLGSAEYADRPAIYYMDEAFPVVDGKISYPKTIAWTHTSGAEARQFAVTEFAESIKAIK